jgi:translocator protein
MAGKKWLGLAGFLVLCFGAAAIGSQFMPGEWYAQLRKPDWNPPNSVFGPVWTILYAMMAVAGWLVWKERGFDGARAALMLFVGQLALNTAWSWLFFGLERADLAFADIVVLWLAILATIVAFWRINRVAGALLIPYLLWVSFAAALNFTIWRMNVTS